MGNVASVVLAAGRSSRMGACKPLLRSGEETLLARAIRAAREGGCSAVLVVAGSNFERVAAEAEARGAEPVLNPGWSEGIGTSIAAGVARLDREGSIDAALLLACDQPHVEAADISRIIARFRNSAPSLVASDYGNGSFGIPALFAKLLFAALLRLTGDSGAKSLIERERERALFVELPRALIDLDTPEEWARFRMRFQPSGYRTRSDPRGRRRCASRPAKP